MIYGNHGLKFTKEQKQLLEGERVTYAREGTREGWTGTIIFVQAGCNCTKFKVTWDQAENYWENHTTYSICALLHPEKAFIILDDKDLIMSYPNTVLNGKFFMLVDEGGVALTGMISEENAVTYAKELAQQLPGKKFYVTKAVLKVHVPAPEVVQDIITHSKPQ